ncbi:MAG: CidA/LrgA family protein [Spirochaetae bacterium HGW-Spirochaetae-8]|jgi:holin-like protein|nr:MAG: CidA/LrgA family protein [Spirochaetae bacterium HGW-Spirochaetae-8]
MRILTQMALILAIGFSGLAISMILPVPLPGSIVGMLLLLLLLLLKVLQLKHIKDIADFFLRNMGVFFVPACVALVEHFDLLQDKFAAFVLICVISTIVTFAATAGAVSLVIRLQRKTKGDLAN